jgi:hypothetical protein
VSCAAATVNRSRYFLRESTRPLSAEAEVDKFVNAWRRATRLGSCVSFIASSKYPRSRFFRIKLVWRPKPIEDAAPRSAAALLLLQQQGLIKVRDGVGILPSVRDIVANPKKFEFRELDAAQLQRGLPDLDAVIINTNYALRGEMCCSCSTRAGTSEVIAGTSAVGPHERPLDSIDSGRPD